MLELQIYNQEKVVMRLDKYQNRIKFDIPISDNNGIVFEKDIWYNVRVDKIKKDNITYETFTIEVDGIEERLSRNTLDKNEISYQLEKGDKM